MRWALWMIAIASASAHAQPAELREEEEVVSLGWSARLAGPAAREGLRHPEAELRARAARALGQRGEHHRAVAALLDALEAEEDPRVRPHIFEALARRGDPSSIPRIARRLGDLGQEDRALALRTVAAIGGEPAIRLLVEWLGAADVGAAAANALADIGAPATPHVIRALRAPIATARAAEALGRIGDARATPALVAMLASALPPARVAILEALGAIGDERAVPAIVRALGDPSDEIVIAALGALGRTGGPELANVLASRADEGSLEARARALEVLIHVDPHAAAPRVRAVLIDEQAAPILRRAVIDALIAHPSRELAPSLALLARDPALRTAAAEALARIPEGEGLPALLEIGADVPLALAVRRFRGRTDVGAAERALREDTTLRGAVVRALARDRSALPALIDALDAERPADRASAALGIALLGEDAPIADRLDVETDDRAFRALALAASATGVEVSVDRLARRFEHAEIAPEVFWLAAPHLERASPATRQRAQRAMRAALRSPDPRVRSGAALALARAGDRSAWRALLPVLEDEHDAVRLAAARALASLGVGESMPALAARARVERDPDVRRALRSAMTRSVQPASVNGGEVLFVRVVAAAGLRRDRPDDPLIADLLLPDGRWLRTTALEHGEILYPGLPDGEAEVYVRP